MSKQRPSADKMTNELAGASAFFRQAPAAKPESVSETAPTSTPVAPTTIPSAPQEFVPEAKKVERTPRTPVRPDRRQMIRHAFEMYLDQLDALRVLADDQRRRGQPASMSRMVRDAIDRYLDEAGPDASN